MTFQNVGRDVIKLLVCQIVWIRFAKSAYSVGRYFVMSLYVGTTKVLWSF